MIFKQNNRRKWFALTYVILFFILEVLIVSNNSFILGIDHSIQNIFQSMVTNGNTKLFSAITFLGIPVMDVIYIVLIMFVLFYKGLKESSLWAGFILIGGNILSFLIKITVRRTRPINKIVPASGYSFPSGHVFGTTLLLLIIIFLVFPLIKNQSNKNIVKTFLIIWLILVAISRVYLRGHFPSDVIGSVLLAGAWWECTEMLYVRYYDSVMSRLKKSDID